MKIIIIIISSSSSSSYNIVTVPAAQILFYLPT